MSSWLQELFHRAIELGANDLHLDTGLPPRLRIRSELKPLDLPPVTREAMTEAVKGLIGEAAWARFEKERSLDTALSVSIQGSLCRFRLNVFFSEAGISLAGRLLPGNFRSFEELHLPPEVASFTTFEDGLVLVSGPTGSGKSTTLAAMLMRINRESPDHILTIEDPIEYLLPPMKALVRQREVGRHVHSFAEALRDAMREDPDVILVGELRDRATAEIALSAAETGHLVFSTLHAGDSVGAVERLAGLFEAGDRDAIRYQVSRVLRGVIAQRLFISEDRASLYPAVEILRNTASVSNLIRTGKTNQISSILETGLREGMRPMEYSLAELVVIGAVALDRAQKAAPSASRFQSYLTELERQGS